MMARATLDDLADVRAGDKGDTLILAVVSRRTDDFDFLVGRLTPELVARHFHCRANDVNRTVLPQVTAMVFRLRAVLGGGVTGSTALDGHGKTLSYHLLTLRLDT